MGSSFILSFSIVFVEDDTDDVDDINSFNRASYDSTVVEYSNFSLFVKACSDSMYET